MRKLVSRICVAGCLAASIWTAPALAGDAGAGTVNTIIVNSEGKAFFNQTGARSGAPACATMTNRWTFDVTTAKGQAMLAVVLTAYSTGKQVAVHGIGSCPDWGDTETVDYIATMN